MPPRKEVRQANLNRMEGQLHDKYGDIGYDKLPLVEGDITDNYNLGEQLCQGWFAKVIDARTKDSDEPRAIKVMEVANADTAVRKAWLAQEIEITRRVQHKNIVKLYEIVRNDKFYYFVYEKVKSDLWDFLRKLRGDSLWVAQWHAAYLMYGVMDVIQYLHKHDIVHRDIKPENLLLDECGNVRVTDFGIAKVISNKCTPFGSRSYMAPEIVSGIRQGCDMTADEVEKVLMTKESVKGLDVWSCGIVLYFLLVGKFPPIIGMAKEVLQQYNQSPETWKQTIFPKKREMKWGLIPEDVRSLILAMLSLDPLKRPSASQTLAHPFFASVQQLDGKDPRSKTEFAEGIDISIDELQSDVNAHVAEIRVAFEQDNL